MCNLDSLSALQEESGRRIALMTQASHGIQSLFDNLERNLAREVDKARLKLSGIRSKFARARDARRAARSKRDIAEKTEHAIVGELHAAEHDLHELRAECEHKDAAAQKELQLIAAMKAKVNDLHHVSVADLETDANKADDISEELSKIAETMLDVKVGGDICRLICCVNVLVCPIQHLDDSEMGFGRKSKKQTAVTLARTM